MLKAQLRDKENLLQQSERENRNADTRHDLAIRAIEARIREMRAREQQNSKAAEMEKTERVRRQEQALQEKRAREAREIWRKQQASAQTARSPPNRQAERNDSKEVYLIDVTTLGHAAFTTRGVDDQNFQSVLESPKVIKVFFDIRNDSDALFSLYGIRVAGIEDLQLMELASRTFPKRHVNGLAKCIERDAFINFLERRKWQAIKEKGQDLFDPSRGGSYAVFDQRPLSQEIVNYCVQDVVFMPHLREVYRRRLCDAWWQKVIAETKTRIQISQSPMYRAKGQHKALAPSGWLSWQPNSSEKGLRTLLQEVPIRGRVLKASPAMPREDTITPTVDDLNGLADMFREIARTRSASPGS